MPMYGQSFSLADNKENGLNVATYGGGEAGEETRARGFLSYYEASSSFIPTSEYTTIFNCVPDLLEYPEKGLENRPR